MASLARRLAPAAALGGLAVVIVGVADPAIANLGRADTPSPASVSDEPVAAEAPAADVPATDVPATEAPAEESTATCASGQTVTGDSVMTRWGPVQVAATVDGGRICEVHAVAWPSNDGKSQQINAYAIPYLDQMATESEGTQLDYVSGATYTSDAYAQSLQSILDSM
jgi:uncharacterized protein with FMN-binding domain